MGKDLVRERGGVVILAPIPPPMHGAAYATQCLISSRRVGEDVRLIHINAQFSGAINMLQRWSWRKVALIFRYIGELAAACVFRKVDVVVLEPAFYFKPLLKDSIFILFSSLILRRKTVLWFHMDFKTLGYLKLNWVWQSYFRFVISRAHRCVCVAGSLVKEIGSIVSDEKIVVIPNGVPEVFQGEGARGTKGERVNVLYISNMDTAKGWKILFEAAEMVCDSSPGVEFDFYGAPTVGNSGESILGFFRSGQYSERVRYHGFVGGAEKEAAYSRADVFCLPSFNEAFPLTVLEAMAAGLPVVASNVGGVGDALLDGDGGFLVPPRDSLALAARLGVVCSDAGLRKSMGAFNRRRYEQFFSLEVFERNWANFLKDVGA